MGRIPRSRVVRLWEETARRLPDPNLGLHLGERVRPRAANVVTYLMMSSRTLREGLERLVRYQRILGGGSRIKLVEDGENGFVRVEFGSDELPATRDEIEYWTVLLLKYGRWITDLDIGLVEVRFSYPAPPDTREHQRIFGCPLRFDAPEGGLVIESAELDRASVHANPDIARAHEEFAQEYLAGLENFTTTRKLRELLLAVLDQGPLNLSTVAEGVESYQQLLMLGSYGCNRMQGYLFGKPAPQQILGEWLENPEFNWDKGDGVETDPPDYR